MDSRDSSSSPAKSMPRKRKANEKMVCVYVPPWLHQSIKMLALGDEMTMQDWIVEKLTETVKDAGQISLPIPNSGKPDNGNGKSDDSEE